MGGHTLSEEQMCVWGGSEKKVGEWEEVREKNWDSYAKLKKQNKSTCLVVSLAMKMWLLVLKQANKLWTDIEPDLHI